MLALLAHFHVGITDVVREETINRGNRAEASAEAQALLTYYNQSARLIQTFPTQVGAENAYTESKIISNVSDPGPIH